MSKLLLFIFLILPNLGSAQENPQVELEGTEDITLQDPFLSLKYQRGAFLVYDCYAKHWVCTSNIEFKQCQESREFALDERTRILPCAPVRELSSEEACVKHQRILVDSAMQNRFCLHPENREVEKVY